MRYVTLILLVLLMVGALPLAQAAPTSQDGDPEAIAQEFLQTFLAGDFEEATGYFDSVMSENVSTNQLADIYDQIIEQVGAYQEQLGIVSQAMPDQDLWLVIITLQFEQTKLDAQIAVNDVGEVAGLYFQVVDDATFDNRAALPDYVDPAAFEEQDITVGSGEWELPGTLTLPTGEGPFPAVVLVHGSGPQDRNESIGPNMPFRDLAMGLASRGIAVLRYDKRTWVYQQELAENVDEVTVQEETIDDALAAVETLQQLDVIDPARIFVLGHSLGGYLMPRIANQAEPGDLAGVIVMAGNARALEDLIVEQVRYLAGQDGQFSETEEQQFFEVETEAQQVKELESPDDTDDLLLGVPAAYWLDLQDYEPTALIQDIDLPMLFLQGERDYQVTMTDFQLWQAALEGRDDVTFIAYPALNHLFMFGRGPSSAQEYQIANHVDEAVINDLAEWLLAF